MEKLLITKTDINEFYNIGANIDQSRTDPNINRAQITDLQPILGASLYYDLINNALLAKVIKIGDPLSDPFSSIAFNDDSEFLQKIKIPINATDLYVFFSTNMAGSGNPSMMMGLWTIDGAGDPDAETSTFVPTQYLNRGFWRSITGQVFVLNELRGLSLQVLDKLNVDSMYMGRSTKQLYEEDAFYTSSQPPSWTKYTANDYMGRFAFPDPNGEIYFPDPKYYDLFFGTIYEYNGNDIYFRGIYPMLCAYAYARLLEINQVHITRAGVGNKESEFSTQEEAAQLQQQIRNARGDAILLRGELEMFLESNISTYDLWERTGEKKTAFNITPVKGYPSIKQY